MTFLLGIEQLTKDEKVSLLSQIEALSTSTLLNDTAQKYSKKGKEFLLKAAANIANRISDETGKRINDFNSSTDWNPEVLQKKILEKYDCFSKISEDELNKSLMKKMGEIAKFKTNVGNDVMANGIIHRAAKSLKIDYRLYLTSTSLESVVFEECVKEQIQQIKKTINKMDKTELDKFENLLNIELAKLSSAEQEALKKTLKVDKISGQAMITFIKTVSSAALIQMILGGFGFSFFLFITTFMKALSLLIGVTFSFGAYSTVTTAFGFLLSVPFLLITILISGGIITKFTNVKIDDEVAKLLILLGRSKPLT